MLGSPVESPDAATSSVGDSLVRRTGRKSLEKEHLNDSRDEARPPAAWDGTDLLMAAKRREKQGDQRKRLCATKKPCPEACCNDGKCLCLLETLTPPSLNAIRSDGWEEVEMAVDSGASETVIGEEMVASAELRESEGSHRGVEDRVANGDSLPNLGENDSAPGPMKESTGTSRRKFAQPNRACLASKND